MSELTWLDKVLDFIFNRKLWCYLGSHSWTWKLESGDTIYLNGGVPEHAVCSKCGKAYKELNNG